MFFSAIVLFFPSCLLSVKKKSKGTSPSPSCLNELHLYTVMRQAAGSGSWGGSVKTWQFEIIHRTRVIKITRHLPPALMRGLRSRVTQSAVIYFVLDHSETLFNHIF